MLKLSNPLHFYKRNLLTLSEFGRKMNGTALADIWDWWRWELQHAFNIQKPSCTSSAIVVSIVRDSCLISEHLYGASETIEGTSLDSVGERTKLLTNATSCSITISEGRYLSRHLSDRQLPFSRARQMASIDLADGTPFTQSDVYICLPENPDATRGTSYFLIRKDVLDPVIGSLVAAGVQPVALAVKTPDGEVWISRQSLRDIHPAFVRKSWNDKLLVGTVALLAALTVLTYGHSYYRYSQAESVLDEQVASRQKAALEVRKLLDQREKDIAAVEAARKSKAQAVPVVRVWEELSRTLPDNVWITDFSVNGDTLVFNGFSGAAAELISTLDASPLFVNPSFTSPVVRIPGQEGERFAIKLSVVRG